MDLIPNLEPAKEIVPTVCPLDHPAPRAMPLLPLRRLTPPWDMPRVAAPRHRAADVRVIVTLVEQEMLPRPLGRRPPRHARVHHRLEPRLVMRVRARERHAERDAVGVDMEMALGPELGPIRGILPRAIPPFTGAATVTLSTACQRQSMPFHSSYSARHSFQSLPKTPVRTQTWKCSCAVEPEPYSRGIIFHWQPVRRTYRMPLRMVRWSLGGRPPLGERGSRGTSGAALAQKASGMSRQPSLRGRGPRCFCRRGMGDTSNFPPYASIGHLRPLLQGFRTHSKYPSIVSSFHRWPRRDNRK
jgi:hypothetical protein